MQPRSLFLTLTLLLHGCSGTAGGVNIWKAVDADDAAAIKKYAASEGDLNVQSRGESPLSKALSDGRSNAYEALLESGADVNQFLGKDRNVVFLAAEHADPKWLQQAIAHGANINLTNPAARSSLRRGPPLDNAISENQIENCRILLEHGADIEVLNGDGLSPLAAAMAQVKLEIVMLLLEAGADFRRPIATGRTDLQFLRQVKGKKPEFYLQPAHKQGLQRIRDWLTAKGVDWNAI